MQLHSGPSLISGILLKLWNTEIPATVYIFRLYFQAGLAHWKAFRSISAAAAAVQPI